MSDRTEPRRPVFADWIRRYGVRAIARDLGISHVAVHYWKRWALGGKGSPPSLDRIEAILKIGRGQITREDILGPQS